MKGIEIPFGAKDSELCGWEYTIPEGMEAVVEGGKVIVRKKESEDERIRKAALEGIEYLEHKLGWDFIGDTDILNVKEYLERQKEEADRRLEMVEQHCKNVDELGEKIKSLQKKLYGKQKEQKPSEKQDYSGLNDLERAIHRGFLSAGVENVPVTIIKETAQECLLQMKPAEWSEEDEDKVDVICKLIERATIIPRSGDDDTGIPPTRLNDKYKGELKAFVKSLRLRSHWKPSEDQMDHLAYAYTQLKLQKCYAPHVYESLSSLYDDLKKHFSL